ncbi:hypothetical protein HDU99_010359 [Rhizoclosmatium hyalinum]|nr:hypothetical protein HDU99_010359 [Rhizoclosmatium hyalinum]
MAVAPEEDEEPKDLEIGNATRLTILETAQMHEDFSSHNNSDQPPLQTNSEPPNDKGKSPVYLNPETINDNEPSQAITEADLPSGAATNCAICFCDFESGDVIRELACLHIFHVDCIDPWLIIQGPASSKENGRPSPPKAHRTCPLCVREAILPEFRDKDVELAMELQKKEEEEMAKVLERLKKEAEEEQLLIERRRKREEERSKRRAKNGLGSLLGRGRSHTADPSNAVAPESKPTRSSSYTGGAIAITAQPDNSPDSPQERVSTMKSKLQTIKSRLLESNEGSSESYAEAQKIEAIIDSVQSGLNAEHKDGNMEIGENSEKS